MVFEFVLLRIKALALALEVQNEFCVVAHVSHFDPSYFHGNTAALKVSGPKVFARIRSGYSHS
jgi:hypothetical protein